MRSSLLQEHQHVLPVLPAGDEAMGMRSSLLQEHQHVLPRLVPPWVMRSSRHAVRACPYSPNHCMAQVMGGMAVNGFASAEQCFSRPLHGAGDGRHGGEWVCFSRAMLHQTIAWRR
jgi:hypothetical protein